jgi:hypothetical protein
MAYYIVRVELRENLSVEAYYRLHTLMAQNGFRQTIEGSDSGQYLQEALPHATYAGHSELGCGSLRDALANLITSMIQLEIVLLVARIAEWGVYSS